MTGQEQVKAWKEWIESSEGEKCRSGMATGKYLENRLLCAFNAAIKVADRTPVELRTKEEM